MKNKKRVISSILSFLIILSSSLFSEVKVKAEIDVEAPVLNSISIDKTSVVAGENVKITVDAMDNGGSGIDYLVVIYGTPITNKSKNIRLDNISGTKYEGILSLSDIDESGIWKIKYVYLSDSLDNTNVFYNSNTVTNGENRKDFSNCDFELKGTTADIEAPVLNNISIDKTSVVPGQSIKVTVDAIDNGGSGIKFLTVFYYTPITKKSRHVRLANVFGTTKYEGVLKLSDIDERGTWKIQYVYLTDSVDNSIGFDNSNTVTNGENRKDFSNCDFKLNGMSADIEAPVLNNINIDKTSVVQGESIKVTVDAIDNGGSGIDYLTVFYYTPITNNTRYIRLDNVIGTTKYEGILSLSDIDEPGTWKIQYVYLSDNVDNSIALYNSNTVSYEQNRKDFSSCDFKLKESDNSIEPLPQKYITGNEYWRSNTINGDLYIGPNALLTINGSVTVDGNVYVLGAIKNYGNLNVTGRIYSRKFNWGDSTIYNGTVLMFGGNNSIGSSRPSNDPIDIPLKVYGTDEENTLIAKEGILNITGVTLPIADLYVDGSKVNYNYSGKFSLSLDVSNKDSITLELVDVYGNKKNAKYNVINSNSDGTIPVTGVTIDSTNVNLEIGQSTTVIATVSPVQASNKSVTWKSSNPSVATVDTLGNVTALANGTTTITATTSDGGYTAQYMVEVTEPVSKELSVSYQGHVQNIGWQSYVRDGALAGTEGLGLRVEGFKIKLENAPVGLKIKYKTHVQNIGWQNWVYDGAMAGTEGLAYRVEALQIKLEGIDADKYTVQYQAHVQNEGWQPWVSDGQISGSFGKSQRIEAVRIKIVKVPSVAYQGHVQDIGWQSYVRDGALAGTEGLGLRVEGFKIKLENAPAGLKIKYKTHVQNIGWQNWVYDDAMSGTEGLSYRVEALQIMLEGTDADKYTVQYQAHVQNEGWQPWVSDGQISGSFGKSQRIEALRIKIVKYR